MTLEEKKRLRLLAQRFFRSIDSPARRAMQKWNSSEKGKAAQKRYIESGKAAARRRKRRHENGKDYIRAKKVRDESRVGKKMAGRPWTKNMDLELLRLVREGNTNIEIGEKLGRSLQSIERRRQRINALGLERHDRCEFLIGGR